jgi:NAD(P)-dependent dehydrogenase (short-subunit alcohol dehydrogenase family)
MPGSPLFDITGKKALVTGSGAGIGRALALTLAENGTDVAIVDINAEVAERTADEIRALGVASLAVVCDVTKGDQVEAMVRRVAQHFGRLDIAVNNAGIYVPGDDEEHTEEDWRRVIDINLTGVWLSANAEMRVMRAQSPAGGKIVNTGSLATTRAISNASYDAAKVGVAHMSATLGRQWGQYNINVNTLSPGYVGTAFGKVRSPQQQARLREITPMGHLMRMRDLAGTLLYLVSEASDYVTGENVMVDGGHSVSTWMRPLAERAVPPRIGPEDEVDDDGFAVQLKDDE